jgi:hypothetical protein
LVISVPVFAFPDESARTAVDAGLSFSFQYPMGPDVAVVVEAHDRSL